MSGLQQRTVTYVPREPYEITTAFGAASIDVGAGLDEVVITTNAAGAEELARLIAASKRLDPGPDGQPPDSDSAAWFGVVVDLLASAALSDAGRFAPPQVLRLEGVAR